MEGAGGLGVRTHGNRAAMCWLQLLQCEHTLPGPLSLPLVITHTSSKTVRAGQCWQGPPDLAPRQLQKHRDV